MRNIVPIVSSVTALIVTPIVSLLTRRREQQVALIWKAFNGDAADPNDDFSFIPQSLIGRAGMTVALAGFAVFVVGVLSGAAAFVYAAPMAIGGLALVLSGGLVRVYAR